MPSTATDTALACGGCEDDTRSGAPDDDTRASSSSSRSPSRILRACVKNNFASRSAMFSMKYVLPARLQYTRFSWEHPIKTEKNDNLPRGIMNMPPDATITLVSHTLRFTAPSMTKKIF
jgi:hypothetical protein